MFIIILHKKINKGHSQVNFKLILLRYIFYLTTILTRLTVGRRSGAGTGRDGTG